MMDSSILITMSIVHMNISGTNFLQSNENPVKITSAMETEN